MLKFQQPLIQSSVSHDPSEIIVICWFAAQETFLIINAELLLDIFVVTVIYSSQHLKWIKKLLKVFKFRF